MPVRTRVATLDGDYAGWNATLRTNPPMRVLTEFSSGQFDRILSALREVVIDWDFVDEEGQPLPAPADGGLEACPLDLMQGLVRAFNAALVPEADVPKG